MEISTSSAGVIEREEWLPTSHGDVFVKRWKHECRTAGVPIVLLHDSLGCVAMWRSFPETLSRETGREVIAYDRLGFGRSSPRIELPSLRFVSEEAEQYFPSILEQLNLEHFVLMGHSVGGAMAVAIAAWYGHRCWGVIREAAQAFVEPLTICSIDEARQRFESPPELAKLEKFHGPRARWVVDAWTGAWLAAEFRTWNIRTEISGLTCPLLAIHGEKDEYGSAAFPEALVKTAGPAQKILLPDCGHVPHRERAAIVIKRIQQFLSSYISPRETHA